MADKCNQHSNCWWRCLHSSKLLREFIAFSG